MVKIVNSLGDVKIGRQGEVVYQRKYGEQIRRQASPKRAIASEAQIAHRQLYRDALAWRKQLSLPNRRYLDGYCIANWVIDDYKIPLPWSRFAIKLYLEHVHFVIITKPVAGEEAEEALYENYQYVRYGYSLINSTSWAAQTFTPQLAHKITKVGIYLTREGYPGACRVSIRATDGAGHPTGNDLTGIDFNGNDLPTGVPSEFYYFDLPPSPLAANTKYAIVLRAPSGDGLNELWLGKDDTSPTYPRGNVQWSTDSGQSWTTYETLDFYFEEYGLIAGKEATIGLLHVRHPALLTVVHKRGELTVNGYDTLSSLDKEYLTEQVGLDVEAGDTIKATTLPGIEYAYKVV